MQLLCCSSDGTVAYMDFTPSELGTPLTTQEKVGEHPLKLWENVGQHLSPCEITYLAGKNGSTPHLINSSHSCRFSQYLLDIYLTVVSLNISG